MSSEILRKAIAPVKRQAVKLHPNSIEPPSSIQKRLSACNYVLTKRYPVINERNDGLKLMIDYYRYPLATALEMGKQLATMS